MLVRVLIALAVIAAGAVSFTLFRHWHQMRAGRGTVAADRPAILYFQGEGCAPCVTQAHFLERLAARFGDQVAIERIDVGIEREKADRFAVFTIPTTLVVDTAGVVRHANYGLADDRKLAAQLHGLVPLR